ncbi:alpha/beta hydrolase [Gordonia sp. TBRC 11910]|uniref:Alpha/beta hydrolase n=1 Tax=Gordonia asplenii TaxID=2725283 RepID=A0A848KPZ6_9ACTN|nr:alpha/beta hydrolase [Gordonia asplenii]NMO00410.1 alpha/beta hydrolase [Gordonia asplenii]
MTDIATPVGVPLPRPPYDPELVAGLAAMRTIVPALKIDTLEEIRALTKNGIPGAPPIDLTAGGRVVVDELTISTPDAELPMVVLSPAQGDGPWPLIYFIHGGAMVAGGRHLGLDDFLSHVADGTAVVASLDYRLAPEHPDPTPVTDCYNGLTWCVEHHDDLRIDASHVIVAGTSAGGGLAAGVALMSRDAGTPALTHQILICPMLDDRYATHSSVMLDDDGSWDSIGTLFGWTALLGDRRGGDEVSYYAAPTRATVLAGLPPAYLDVGSAEGFRDEVIDYAARLSQAGVSVDLHMWAGGFHGFENISTAAVSQASASARNDFIRRALRG